MEKEKTYYWDNFNPIDLFMWKNQSHLKLKIKNKMLGGNKNTGIKFNPSNQHITFTASHYSRANRKWYKKEIKSYPYMTILCNSNVRKQFKESGLTPPENIMLKEFLEALKLTQDKKYNQQVRA